MDTLLPIKPHPLPIPALLLQRLLVGFRLKGRADQVDGRGQIGGSGGGDDGGAGEEEFGEGGRSGKGEVEGEVFGGED